MANKRDNCFLIPFVAIRDKIRNRSRLSRSRPSYPSGTPQPESSVVASPVPPTSQSHMLYSPAEHHMSVRSPLPQDVQGNSSNCAELSRHQSTENIRRDQAVKYELSRTSSSNIASQPEPSIAPSTVPPTPQSHKSYSPTGPHTSVQSPLQEVHGSASNQAKGNVKTVLSGAYEILNVIKEASDAFGPLKSAVGGIVACINMYKNASGNYEEMERLLASITQVLSMLKEEIEESKNNKDLDKLVKKHSEQLEQEVEKIQNMHGRGLFVRLAHNSDDAGKLASSYRTIKDTLDLLHVDIGLSLQRKTHDILKHAVFRSLPRSHDASYDAVINLESVSRRICTKDTRVDIIARIMDWAMETDLTITPSVYWLNGLGGLGKTTIAYTICELLNKAGHPFTSFFCSRQLDSKDSKLLITTICRDLSEIFSSYANEVLPVLETNSKIINTGLRRQIEELLAKPWQASITRRKGLPTPVIVMDALDENNRGSEFMEALLHVVQSDQLVGIKFLVTGRPDPTLIELCESFPPHTVCKLHEIELSEVQNDIKKYLREALPDQEHNPDLEILADRACGFFIYAATAVRILTPPRYLSPLSTSERTSKLHDILSSWPTTSESPGQLALDELYQNVLGVAFWSASVRQKRLRILHTILCAQSRIGISVIAELSDTDEATTKVVLESLHAVLVVSPKDNGVYWYHTSFPDFIFDEGRAKFNFSPSQIIQARRLTYTTSLCFNICELESSYFFDSEVPDLPSRTTDKINPALRYASQHWSGHLSRAAPSQNGESDLVNFLDQFVTDKLLFWIEAMNLIDAKFECAQMLSDAEGWLMAKQIQHPNLIEYLADAAHFSTYFAGSQAALSTPHLYISALATWRQASPVWTVWKPKFACIPLISLSMGSITVPLLTMAAGSPILCVAYTSKGNHIVSGSTDGLVQVWDANTGQRVSELKNRLHGVSAAIAPDGSRIVSGSSDGLVRIWDARTGEQLWGLPGNGGRVNSVAFSSDGSRIVSGSDSHSVTIWDARTGEQLRELQGHIGHVNSVAFSSDGSRIVSGSDDYSVRIWDARTGEQLWGLPGHTGHVNSVAFSSDGSRIVSGSDDHLVRIWDARLGEQFRELQGHTKRVISAAFSPDGTQIVSGSCDNSVRIWDARTGEQLWGLPGHTGHVNAVAFSYDGSRIVSGSDDHLARIWDARTGEQLWGLPGHTDHVNAVAFSYDGSRIVSGSDDHLVRIWDARTGEQLWGLPGHTGHVNAVAFSYDGSRIVSGSDDYSVRIWNARTGEQLRELQGHTRATSAVFSSDGTRIVSGSYDHSVRIWDAWTGELLNELRTGEELTLQICDYRTMVTWVAISPDGSRIVSTSGDNSVRVWDVWTGKQLNDPQFGYTTGNTSVAISSDGSRIVTISSGSYDHSVRIWDAWTGELLNELRKGKQLIEPHLDYITRATSIAISSDNSQIVSTSSNSSVRVWDAKTGEQLSELQGHTDWVTAVSFSPDGTRIVSGSMDNSVRIWDNTEFSTTSWFADVDGWIISNGNQVMWIPPTIRNILHHPHSQLIISRQGSATVSFDDNKLGPFWHNCYTPPVSATQT